MKSPILPVHRLMAKWLLHNKKAYFEMDREERRLVYGLQHLRDAHSLTLSALKLIYSRIRIIRGIGKRD